MKRKNISFLVQRLYLPLLVVMLLIVFCIVVLQSAWEKKTQLSLLVKEVEHVHLNLQDAAILVEKYSVQEIPVKALQITNSLSRIESSMRPESINEKVSAEWKSMKYAWNSLKGVGQDKKQQAKPLSSLEKNQIAVGFDELRILCQRLKSDLVLALQDVHFLTNVLNGSVLVLFLGLLGYVSIFLHVYVLAPIVQLQAYAQGLASGRGSFVGGESNTLVESVYMTLEQNEETRRYVALAAEQIGDGNFQQDEKALQQAGVLGASVLDLRQKMQAFFLEEQRRNWNSQGLEQFTKLLREQSVSVEGLCKSLVSELVLFMNANQGAVFVAEADEQGEETLQLQAFYAWGRHKFQTKTIQAGEGLIGQVIQEKEMLMFTDIPEDYITIGSGLGRAKPRCIIILPLTANDVFQGAVELASFRVFEAHELAFMQKIAENVASSLANLKSSTKTRELLAKANAANVHLQAQEEELRQNTEELIATQEAMEKKDIELVGLFTSINYSLYTAEFGLDGLLLSANDKLKQFLKIQDKAGQTYQCFELVQVPGWSRQDIARFMQQLSAGQPHNLECQFIQKSNTWISASFTPILNAAGEVYKVMMLGSDISEKKNAQLAYMAQAEDITRQEEKLRHYTAELEELQAGLASRLQEAHQEMEMQIREIALEKEKNVAILEGCVDGVVSFNEKGIVEYFNRAAEEIWETPRYQALGSNIRNLISIEIQYQGAEPQVFFSKNGTKKQLDIRTEVPLFGANGEEIEALLTLTKVKIDNSFMFTAFVQKVAVELF